jgi:hypothetical protein
MSSMSIFTSAWLEAMGQQDVIKPSAEAFVEMMRSRPHQEVKGRSVNTHTRIKSTNTLLPVSVVPAAEEKLEEDEEMVTDKAEDEDEEMEIEKEEEKEDDNNADNVREGGGEGGR